MAAQLGLAISQHDVKNAFLNGSLHELVYLKPPEGYSIESGMVLKLCKPLYGLKQAPLEWNRDLNKTLTEKMGFRCLVADPGLYIRRIEGRIQLVGGHVDDLLEASVKGSGDAELFK